jgi:hypothetical protein
MEMLVFLPAFALWLLQQPVATSWNLRAIDLLITALLTTVLGLARWALVTVREYRKDLKENKDAQDVQLKEINANVQRIAQQVWGVDGRNGHASELRDLKRSFRRIERYILRLGARVGRVEDKVGLPSGEHPRLDDDDAEDDRRG